MGERREKGERERRNIGVLVNEFLNESILGLEIRAFTIIDRAKLCIYMKAIGNSAYIFHT